MMDKHESWTIENRSLSPVRNAASTTLGVRRLSGGVGPGGETLFDLACSAELAKRFLAETALHVTLCNMM